MRLARKATPPPRDEQVWPAGVEPAISGAQNRRGGHLPYSQRRVDPDAALAASGKSTTVESNHASPPYQSGACPAGPSSMLAGADRKSASADFRSRRSLKPAASRPGRCARRQSWGVARESHPAPRIHSPRARYKPCDAVSPGGVEPPSATVEAWCSSTELRREALSTGIEPASPGRQPGRISQTRPRACESAPSGIRTRVSGVRDRNPRPLDDRGMKRGCDGWGRTSVSRVTTGRPAVERRRIVHMDTPARFERARVGPKPTALLR